MMMLRSGVDDRFVVFVTSTCCTLLSVVAGEAIGLLVGASIADLPTALTVMTVSTLGLMLLGGFFEDELLLTSMLIHMYLKDALAASPSDKALVRLLF